METSVKGLEEMPAAIRAKGPAAEATSATDLPSEESAAATNRRPTADLAGSLGLVQATALAAATDLGLATVSALEPNRLDQAEEQAGAAAGAGTCPVGREEGEMATFQEDLAAEEAETCLAGQAEEAMACFQGDPAAEEAETCPDGREEAVMATFQGGPVEEEAETCPDGREAAVMAIFQGDPVEEAAESSLIDPAEAIDLAEAESTLPRLAAAASETGLG